MTNYVVFLNIKHYRLLSIILLKMIILVMKGGDIMDRVEQLLKKIEETRSYMNDLIRERSDLLDSEVIIASQMLDSILDEYYKILQQENISK